MKLTSSLFLTVALLCPLFLAAEVTPDTVVATVNGDKLTAGEIDTILAGAPPEIREQLAGDRRQFLQQYAVVSRLAEAAIEEEIDEKSPYREQLDWNRGQVLLQAAIAAQARKLQESGAGQASVEAGMKEWLEEVRNSTEASYENQDYFSDDLEVAAKVDDETVVVKVNGDPVTAGQVKNILRGSAPRVRENFQKDRRRFFQEYAMMRRLVKIAEEQKLGEASPYREQLAWVRNNVLSQARLDEYTNGINIDRTAEQEYYTANQDKYSIARVKVLYVSFGSGDAVGTEVGGKKILSEAEAKSKIDGILEELRNGADFVEMVKEHSEDETSKAKDGDFGSIHRNENIPAHIKEAVFGLKEGEVSDPVRQPNGFYLFRAEEVRTKPLDEVRQELNREAKVAKFNEWFEGVRNTIEVTVENEEYFAATDK